jgi:ribosomal protein L7/L12
MVEVKKWQSRISIEKDGRYVTEVGCYGAKDIIDGKTNFAALTAEENEAIRPQVAAIVATGTYLVFDRLA